MGKADTVTKAYMSKRNIFADAFNYLIYDGASVVDPGRLKEIDTTELTLPFNLQGEEVAEPVQRYRDILKRAVIMQEDETAYILLGIENQTDIHYAMPVRNMVYDALQYSKQVADTAVRHRKKDRGLKRVSKGEYLSGFYKEDVLRPVITLVIHFGAETWDAPLSLHEMMGTKDEKLLRFVQDYQIHLIDPARLTEEELKKFRSSLREVIEYIKYSKDEKELSRILKDNPRMVIDREAALVIKTITNTPIEIPEGKEEIDMCRAVEVMMNESREQGIEIGMVKGLEQGIEQGIEQGLAEGIERGIEQGLEIGAIRMLIKQVGKGRITIEEAAEDAALTVEEFKKISEEM